MRIVRLVDGGLDYVVNIAEGRGSKYFYRPKDGISAAVSPLWGGAVYETYSLDGAIAVFEGDEILGSSLVIVRDTHTITVECASHRVQRVQLEALAQKFGQAAE